MGTRQSKNTAFSKAGGWRQSGFFGAILLTLGVTILCRRQERQRSLLGRLVQVFHVKH